MPTLGDTFEEYMAASPNRSKRTNELYRYDNEAKRYLGDWLTGPLDAIARKDVETRFNNITADHGWSAANRAMSLLRSVYRMPCVDLDGLRNPVDLWLAGGGKFHRKTSAARSRPRQRCCRAGAPGSRRRCTTRRSGTLSGSGSTPACAARRCSHSAGSGSTWQRSPSGSRRPRPACPWSFRSPGNSRPFSIAAWPRSTTTRQALATGCFPRPPAATGHVQDIHHLYSRIDKAGSAKFWFHGLRNCFITVAERELMLPSVADQAAGEPRTPQ